MWLIEKLFGKKKKSAKPSEIVEQFIKGLNDHLSDDKKLRYPTPLALLNNN